VHRNDIDLERLRQQSRCDYVGRVLAMLPKRDPIGRDGGKKQDLTY
jgi:hypothetical protein